MSVNKAIIIGRLGKDPETRYMTNGEAVTNVSIATSESWKDKAGEKQERTEWHNLVFYRRLAEIAGEYLKKGSMIYVEGRIQARKWQDKEGKDRYTTEIVVNEMTMLGSKRDGDMSEADGDKSGATPKPARQATDTAKPAAKGSFDNFDDDIPFAHHGKCGAGVSWRAM